jgi:hypothetical protein
VAKGDVEAAAAAIVDRIGRGRLAPSVLAGVRARLGWDAVLDRYEELFGELLARRTRSDHGAPAGVASGAAGG